MPTSEPLTQALLRPSRRVDDESEPQESHMGWWREQVVPRVADKTLNARPLHKERARLCAGLGGDVLEIGFGSGLNLRHYPAAVRGVWAVEPSDVAWRLAGPRIAERGLPVVRAGLDGQRLDLPDARFDAVVSTFTMCTIPDLDAALAEVRRVLRPGGQLHFLEHGAAPDERVARWQDRLQPVNGRIAGGCHLNRPIAERVAASGLAAGDVDMFYGDGPKPFAFLYRGRADKPADKRADTAD
jgi:SAM-dependent methyltransferase